MLLKAEMKLMKKLIMLLIVPLALGLTACGGKKKKSGTGTGDTTTNPGSYKTFFQYCVDFSGDAKTRATIDALMFYYGENDCKTLESRIAVDSVLKFDNLGLKDLSPLARFSKITALSLKDNKITDITPLGAMTNLKRLRISDNFIKDIGPLRNLTALRDLDASRNEIENLGGLKDMNQLKELDLEYNLIRNASPLKELYSLETLELDNNPLGRYEEKTEANCPIDQKTANALRTFCQR